MAKRASSTAIGIFVLGGVALVVIAIAVLGSARLFRHEHRFVCFFDANLNNLSVGAPVKVRGVAIGSVVEILLELPPSEGLLKYQSSTSLPVVIEIDETQLRHHGARTLALRSEAGLDALIKRGLRAQLSMQSLLTGLLYVDLDFHPNSPINLALEPGTGLYPEIPTTPTNLEQAQQKAMSALSKLEKVDFEGLANSITAAATSAHDLLNSPDLKQTIAAMKQSAANLNQMASAVRGNVTSFNDRTGPLIESMKKTSDKADIALAQMQVTMASLQSTIAPDSPLTYRMNAAFDNLSQASSAIRELAEFIRRNPSSIVRGKYVTADHQ